MFQLHIQIPNLSWFVDGANHWAINECKSKYGESLDWEKVEDINIEDDCIIPVNFGKEHKQMLQHLYQLLTKQKLAIDPKYEKLILSSKTAYAEEFSLRHLQFTTTILTVCIFSVRVYDSNDSGI